MQMETVCLINNRSGEALDVPLGETSVGRGPLLKVTDKRVSRHHASLRLVDGKLSLFPKHKNPCFHKPAGDSKYHVLAKDQWKELCHGDCFSLLPDDLIFRVLYPGKDTKSNGTSQKDPLDELFDPTDKPTTKGTPEVKPDTLATPLSHRTDCESDATKTVPSVKTGDNITESGTEKRDGTAEKQSPVPRKMLALADEVDKSNVSIKKSKPNLSSTQSGSTGKKRALPSWLSGLSCDDGTSKTLPAPKKRKAPSTKVAVTKRKDKDDEIGSPPPKKVTKRAKANATEAVVEREAKKKTPSVEPESVELAKEKSVEPAVTEDKLETTPPKESLHVVKDTKEKDKPQCPYGAACYRKNPVHFKEFSHDPSSVDPSASVDSIASDDSDKPICPYGADCYRKNPGHTQEYRHLDVPATKKELKASQRRNNRTTKGIRSVVGGDSDDDGEPNTYDYNDSFIDDGRDQGSSSSYSDSEDSDWSPDAGGVMGGGESEDVNELISEADEFMSNKKMRRTT